MERPAIFLFKKKKKKKKKKMLYVDLSLVYNIVRVYAVCRFIKYNCILLCVFVALERLAGVSSKLERHVSPGEVDFIMKLVKVHGTDYKVCTLASHDGCTLAFVSTCSMGCIEESPTLLRCGFNASLSCGLLDSLCRYAGRTGLNLLRLHCEYC